jgi:hypothetical protein
MVEDVTTPSNPPIAPIEEEELKKTSLDMNVSQRLHEKEPSKKVVCTWINCSAWDYQLSPNPPTLTIDLNLFLLVELRHTGLKHVNVKMTMFIVIIELGFSTMTIIVGYEAQSTPFLWSIEPNI